MWRDDDAVLINEGDDRRIELPIGRLVRENIEAHLDVGAFDDDGRQRLFVDDFSRAMFTSVDAGRIRRRSEAPTRPLVSSFRVQHTTMESQLSKSSSNVSTLTLVSLVWATYGS